MAHLLDIKNWKRKAQYEFFKDFEMPFFNITSDLEVGRLYEFCQTEGFSFFRSSLFLALKAANELEAFRYRIQNDEVIVFDKIDVNTTILRTDNTFFFCALDYFNNYAQFSATATKQILAQSEIAELVPNSEITSVIHFSVIPWINFSSFQHARRLGTLDSVPKIVYGKFARKEGKTLIPISVEVHHALMDGLDVGRYFNLLQSYFNQPNYHLK